MRKLFDPILQIVHGKDAGVIGAAVAFILAILWAIFGFWKTFFIVIFTITGYIIGARLFRNSSHFKELIDKLLPPGRFR